MLQPLKTLNLDIELLNDKPGRPSGGIIMRAHTTFLIGEGVFLSTAQCDLSLQIV